MGRGRVILLDTNILIDLGRYTLRTESTYGASILSRAELEFGIRAAKTAEAAAERTARLNALDDYFDWLAFDLPSTHAYGIVAAGARATGANVRGKDALIAAQAYRHGASLMTTNLEDFRPFDHLVQIVSPTPRD